jgi:hypothetical protein
MALWGISSTSETAANNYAIPKYQLETDRNTSPWNTFADVRGWVQRRYKTRENSGISTRYFDEVLVTVHDLNITNVGVNSQSAGIGTAGPVAVFFEDPNLASPISVGGGATTGIATNTTGYVHVVFNELVFASAGATVSIRAFDANGVSGIETTRIVATAASISPNATQYAWAGTAATHGSPGIFTGYNGQITNRVAFAFTSPSVGLTTNVSFLSTTINTTVALGSTVIYVGSLTGVSAGSSITVGTAITTKPVVSVGDTFVTIGTASTVGSVIGIGTAVTFSTRTVATKLFIDASRGFIGLITDGSNGVGVISSFSQQFGNIIRNVAGAGTTAGVGLGTTTLTVR